MSLDAPRRLEPVPEAEVVRYWLRQAVDDGRDDETPDPDEFATEPALRQELFEREPIAERAFGAEPADWYRTDLSSEELRDLRVVVGPHDEDWRALTDDDRVGSVAELTHDADDLAGLDAETPKDLREVATFADELADGGSVGRLLVRKEGDDPAYVVDGNHRAVGHVLYLLRGGDFEGQEAYLGVTE